MDFVLPLVIFFVLLIIGIACAVVLVKQGILPFMLACGLLVVLGAAFIGFNMGSTFPLRMRLQGGLVSAAGTGAALFIPIMITHRFKAITAAIAGAATGALIATPAFIYLIFTATFRGV